MVLKVFIDYFSQPSRAVLITLKLLNFPFEIVETRIAKGQNRTEEFVKLNPAKKVPTILDDDFNLSESHAIMRYIIRSRNIQTPLYPLNDIKKCAKIDQYLDFHHTTTRKGSIWLFNKVFAKQLGVPSVVDLEQAFKETQVVLKFIDQKLLGNSKFLCGDTMTIADISAFCEIIQLILGQFDLSQYKNITQWLKLIELNPEVQEYHAPFYKIVDKINQQPKL